MKIQSPPRLSFLRRQEPSQDFKAKLVFCYLYEMIFFLYVSLGSCLRGHDNRGAFRNLMIKQNDVIVLNSPSLTFEY